MSTDVVTVGANDKLAVANDVMRLGRIRHMPVVDDDGALIGLVSQRDLFHNALLKALGYGTHAQQSALDSFRAKDAMTSPVVTVGPKMPLSEVARLMLEKKIGCVVVSEDDQIVGIITEGDFVALAAEAK